jgi:hypothetical protein
MIGNSSQHLRSYLYSIMKCPNVIAALGVDKDEVRTFLRFY